MKAIWDRILNEPALIFTIIVTAYTAAIAAGWIPNEAFAVVAAVVIAVGGLFGLRGSVTPTRKLQ